MRLEWSPVAVADREQIFEFIATDSPQAALAVDEKIAAATLQLSRFPDSGRKGRVAGTRELVVHDTPYIVVYEVRTDLVVVLRVIHGAQRWPPRSPAIP